MVIAGNWQGFCKGVWGFTNAFCLRRSVPASLRHSCLSDTTASSTLNQRLDRTWHFNNKAKDSLIGTKKVTHVAEVMINHSTTTPKSCDSTSVLDWLHSVITQQQQQQHDWCLDPSFHSVRNVRHNCATLWHKQRMQGYMFQVDLCQGDLARTVSKAVTLYHYVWPLLQLLCCVLENSCMTSCLVWFFAWYLHCAEDPTFTLCARRPSPWVSQRALPCGKWVLTKAMPLFICTI